MTDFQSKDIVSARELAKGFQHSAPQPSPASTRVGIDHETTIVLEPGPAQFQVAIVSHFDDRQRLKLVGLDAWFPAEAFTLVRRPKDEKTNDAPKCIHCNRPRGSHNQAGDCLVAGFYGNKFDDDSTPEPPQKLAPVCVNCGKAKVQHGMVDNCLGASYDGMRYEPKPPLSDIPEPHWTPAIGSLLKGGIDRVDLNNLQEGQWLLVAVQYDDVGPNEKEIGCIAHRDRDINVFMVKPEAIMGGIEEPEWFGPDLPDEPPVWTVVKTTGLPDPGGTVTIHVRTKDGWVDLSGNRREWPEVCLLDAKGKPEILRPEGQELEDLL